MLDRSSFTVTRPSWPFGLGMVCRSARMTPRPNSSFSPDRVAPGGRATAAARSPGATGMLGMVSCSGGFCCGCSCLGGIFAALPGSLCFGAGPGAVSESRISLSIACAALFCSSRGCGAGGAASTFGAGACLGTGGSDALGCGGAAGAGGWAIAGGAADAPSSRKVFLLFRSASSTSTTLMPSGLPLRSPIWRGDDLVMPKISAACSAATNASPNQKRLSCVPATAARGLSTARVRSAVRATLSAPISPARSHGPVKHRMGA